MTTERMFLAVIPPAEVIEEIADLPTRALRGVRYTRRDQWHVTVKFLGETEMANAFTALGAFDPPAAQVTLGPEVGLLGTRIVMVPVAGLEGVAAAADEAFADVGEPQEERQFAGHITIARLKGAPLRDPSVVSVIGAPITTTFVPESVALFKTEMEPEGAIHTIIAEKALPPS